MPSGFGIGRGLRLFSRIAAGSLLAFDGDTFQKFGGGLIVRILRHQLAAKGVEEDRLAQALRGLQLRVDVGFKVINGGKLIFNGFDHRLLLR